MSHEVSRRFLSREVRTRLAMGAVALATLYTLTLLPGILAVATGGISKMVHDSEAGLTDRRREAIHRAAHERNDAYLRAFVTAQRDPRALPTVWIELYAAPPPTLAAAAFAAGAIVRGQVESSTFAVNPSGGMPLATSRVRVTEAIKGEAGGMVSVLQGGGPVASGTGGALVETVNNELILPGDDVVLLLQPSSPPGTWRTMTGGVYFIRDGVVTGQSAEYYRVRGEPVAHFLARLR